MLSRYMIQDKSSYRVNALGPLYLLQCLALKCFFTLRHQHSWYWFARMDESKENIGAVRPIGWVEFFSCNQRKLTHFTMHCLQKAPTFLPPSPPRSVMLMLALLALIKANSVMNNLHRGLHLSAQSYFINQELYHQKITEQTALWTLCNPRPAPSVHFRLCSSRKFDDQVGLGTSSFYTQCLMAGTMSKLDITINTLIIVVSWLWLPAL